MCLQRDHGPARVETIGAASGSHSPAAPNDPVHSITASTAQSINVDPASQPAGSEAPTTELLKALSAAREEAIERVRSAAETESALLQIQRENAKAQLAVQAASFRRLYSTSLPSCMACR